MQESDNLCKYLAEKYPDSFASWLLRERISSVEVLKTELSLEPVRADSVTFLRTQSQILHLEFQGQVPTGKPMPLRMLNYWMRLYWQYEMPVTQVVIWLKETSSRAVFENEFSMGLTRHPYQVIRMWAQSPEPLLQEPGLLPLATLAATDNAAALLSRVAQQVSNIEEPRHLGEISSYTQLLAGLRFNQKLIRNLFREEIMQESVIYQEILQTGKQQEAIAMVMRPLARRVGTLDSELLARLRALSIEQLEDLGEALLDFSSVADLVAWLQSR